MRKMLEVSYEAWVDSGVDHKELRGSSKVMQQLLNVFSEGSVFQLESSKVSYFDKADLN